MRRMGREERLQHVKGLYRVDHPSKVKGKRVLVVDDVSTTGATEPIVDRARVKLGDPRMATDSTSPVRAHET